MSGVDIHHQLKLKTNSQAWRIRYSKITLNERRSKIRRNEPMFDNTNSNKKQKVLGLPLFPFSLNKGFSWNYDKKKKKKKTTIAYTCALYFLQYYTIRLYSLLKRPMLSKVIQNVVNLYLIPAMNADPFYYLNTKAEIMYAQWFIVRKGDNCFNWNYMWCLRLTKLWRWL